MTRCRVIPIYWTDVAFWIGLLIVAMTEQLWLALLYVGAPVVLVMYRMFFCPPKRKSSQ